MNRVCLAWSLALVLAQTAQPSFAYEHYQDGDDLGFTSGIRRHRTGWLTNRAFSAQDSDAIFIVNNVPLLYRTPRNPLLVEKTEQRFELALENARAGSDHDWRSLAVLLEGVAAFYRKINRRSDSTMALGELVDLLTVRAPGSADLSAAQVALGQTLTAQHQYAAAERQFKDALALAHHLYGARNIEVAQIDSHLYFLYLDMGRADLAAKSRKDAVAASAIDVVAAEDQRVYEQTAINWPAIVRSIDGIATSQEVAQAEQDGDQQALAALRKYRAGVDPNAVVATAQPKKKKDRDKSDEKPPPMPYRINSDNDDNF